MDKRISRTNGCTVIQCGECNTIIHIEDVTDNECPFCYHVFDGFVEEKLPSAKVKQKRIPVDEWKLLRYIEHLKMVVKQINNYLEKMQGMSFAENGSWSRSKIDAIINRRLKAQQILNYRLNNRAIELADAEAKLNDLYRKRM